MYHSKRHIFFDLDHTLWDFDRNSYLTFKKLFKHHNISISLDNFLKVYKPINLNYWKLYRQEKIDKSRLRFARLSDSFSALNLDISPSIINVISDEYIEYLTNYNYLIEGSLEILEYLSVNYKLHIITNGFKEVQHCKLIKSGISNYFETVTNSETVGVKKPNRKIFDHALCLANADIKTSLMIGDNLEADILGSINMGMDALFFNYHNDSIPDGIISIKNLLELKKYL